MKIVHVQQFFNDGFGYQENLLPEYQKDLGHDVTLITSTRSDGFNGESRFRKEGKYLENNFLVKRIRIIFDFPKRFVIFRNLYKELINEQPDYIFHHSATAPSIFAVARYKKRNPKVYVSIDNHADLQISGRNYLWRLFYYNFFWKSCLKVVQKYIDIFFGVTPDRCLFLEKELGIDPDKITLLPIGSDVKRIESISLREDVIIKLPTNKKIIVHGGKMSLYKKTDHLIQALKTVNKDEYQIVLFGSIEDKKLENEIMEIPNLTFLGWLSRVETLYLLKQSHLGIWNGQHTTLLEDAIGCELPLLIKKYGSTSHLINDNDIYLENGNYEEITEKLRSVLEEEYITKLKERTKELNKNISYYNIAEKSVSRVVRR